MSKPVTVVEDDVEAEKSLISAWRNVDDEHDQSPNDSGTAQQESENAAAVKQQSCRVLSQDEEMLIVQCFKMAVHDHDVQDAAQYQDFEAVASSIINKQGGETNINGNDNGNVEERTYLLQHWEPKVLPMR